MNKMFDFPVPKTNRCRIEQTISEGQHYMDTHIPQSNDILIVFKQQLRYISPLVWLCQFIALILFLALFLNNTNNSAASAREIMFIIAPLTTLLGIPELFKDVFSNVSEMELTCKISGAKLLMIRIIIIGFVNIAVLMLFCGVLAANWKLLFINIAVCSLIPVNSIYILTLLLFKILKIHSRIYAIALSLCDAVLSFFVINALNKLIAYNIIIDTIFVLISSALIIALIIYEGWRISSRKDNLLWNY